jgi:hypothetical protein
MCERQAELLSAYLKAVATFSTTLSALEAARATVLRHEYDRLANYVNQAHSRSDLAKNELEKHTSEHGCFQSVRAAQA